MMMPQRRMSYQHSSFLPSRGWSGFSNSGSLRGIQRASTTTCGGGGEWETYSMVMTMWIQ